MRFLEACAKLCAYVQHPIGVDNRSRERPNDIPIYDDKGENDDDEEIRFGCVFAGGVGAFL